MNTAVFAAMAAALVVLGIWAARGADGLVPSYLDAGERVRRVRVIRRGGISCLAVATLFVAVGVADLFS